MDRLYRRVVLTVLAVVLTSATAYAGEAAPPAGEADVDYAAVMLDDKKVGYAKTTREIRADEVTTVNEMALSLNRGGMALSIHERSTVVETPDGKPKAFRSVRRMGAGQPGTAQSVAGVITPDGTLDVTITIGERSTTRNLDWPDGALMSHGLHLLAKEKGLENGTSYTTTIFSPETFSPLELRMDIGETTQIEVFETQRTVVETRQTFQAPMGKMTSTTYVDPATQEPVQATIPMMGMTLTIVTCDKAFAMSPAEDVGDLFGKVALNVPGKLDPKAAGQVYVIEPTDKAAKLSFATTDLQTVTAKDGTFVVTVTAPDWPDGGTMPYTGDNEPACRSLKPTTYIQCDAQLIKDLAARAVGDAKTPADAARNIESFVSEYIDQKDLGVGYASALEVAKARRGDCTEHAMLTAALCRAAGIPAQVVSGVAWVSAWGGQRNVMLPHAWNQVYIDGRWIPLDAALRSHRTVGTGRVVMAVGDGDMASYFGMLSTLGNFRLSEVKAAD
ncbi:MAG: hypothetical protein GVY16_01445 [Planctomycetes bacterium]|jgi:hypothetical protein|nr:transglutaminase domain-containing protein [Phycisphaerae bacterium]NBB94391.1 hypothetical protein [Planctomycetota bacterium]